MTQIRLFSWRLTAIIAAALLCAVVPAQAADPAFAQAAAGQGKKPNILVIWGDDIGIHNISAYSLGVMGSPQGIPDWSPTIAGLLKAQGYTTGQGRELNAIRWKDWKVHFAVWNGN